MEGALSLHGTHAVQMPIPHRHSPGEGPGIGVVIGVDDVLHSLLWQASLKRSFGEHREECLLVEDFDLKLLRFREF
jgi:hypothetical protein